MATNPDYVNTKIQNKNLYGPPTELDYAKTYFKEGKITDGILDGDREFYKISGGAIIISPESIIEEHINRFNEMQKAAMGKCVFLHKTLCERRGEVAALVFLTLGDLVGDVDYKFLGGKELCNLIKNNIQEIILNEFDWVINYSQKIVREYYSLSPQRLKIKLNFLFDDNSYDDENRGGLFIRGLLDELEKYESLADIIGCDIGMICQILCPSGLPENKKWIQIDVGPSLSGKRLIGETMRDLLIREAERICLSINDTDVLNCEDPIYYGGKPEEYEGFEIHFWELFYGDQFSFREPPVLNKRFCKCVERQKIIDQHRNMLKNRPKESSK